ncbi:NUDIX hydrolase domain-like protein, partial [Syncephalis fuscata]
YHGNFCPSTSTATTGSIEHLDALCHSLRRTDTWRIPSPSACRKRASVAAILRVVPTIPIDDIPIQELSSPSSANNTDLTTFFNLPWVKSGKAELLFIRRTSNPQDPWSGQIAFPGGKRESGETDREAAERETREEVGFDITSNTFTFVGALDEREVTTRFGRRLLLILCPFVYLQLTPTTPDPTLSAGEVASLHWCSIDYLLSTPRPHAIRVEIAPRLLPRFITSAAGNGSGSGSRPSGSRRKSSSLSPSAMLLASLARFVYASTCWILGAVRFETIRLPDTEVPLWGLTLTMSLDLLEHTGVRVRSGRGWPRFDWKDLDFWQRSFGKFLNVRSGEADR